jgi:hypothetical protein
MHHFPRFSARDAHRRSDRERVTQISASCGMATRSRVVCREITIEPGILVLYNHSVLVLLRDRELDGGESPHCSTDTKTQQDQLLALRITAPELLVELRRIEARGTHETAHRVRAACSRVYRYAIATGRAERDLAADLVGALVPVESRNFAAVTDPKEVAGRWPRQTCQPFARHNSKSRQPRAFLLFASRSDRCPRRSAYGPHRAWRGLASTRHRGRCRVRSPSRRLRLRTATARAATRSD